MAYIVSTTVSITTASDGSATVYSDKVVQGKIVSLHYTPDATSPLDTGADLTVTGETSGVAIATLSNIGTSAFTKMPRAAVHGVTGTALLFAAGGEAVTDYVRVNNERIKIIVAQGGNAKSGTVLFMVE